MSEKIYSALWGEILYKKGIGSRIYIYEHDHNRLYKPRLILHNKLMVEKLIEFLQKSLKEMKCV